MHFGQKLDYGIAITTSRWLQFLPTSNFPTKWSMAVFLYRTWSLQTMWSSSNSRVTGNDCNSTTFLFQTGVWYLVTFYGIPVKSNLTHSHHIQQLCSGCNVFCRPNRSPQWKFNPRRFSGNLSTAVQWFEAKWENYAPHSRPCSFERLSTRWHTSKQQGH